MWMGALQFFYLVGFTPFFASAYRHASKFRLSLTHTCGIYLAIRVVSRNTATMLEMSTCSKVCLEVIRTCICYFLLHPDNWSYHLFIKMPVSIQVPKAEFILFLFFYSACGIHAPVRWICKCLFSFLTVDDNVGFFCASSGTGAAGYASSNQHTQGYLSKGFG